MAAGILIEPPPSEPVPKGIIPEDNAADLREIPSQITHALEIIPVRWVDEVITHALTSQPSPIKKRTSSKASLKSRAQKKSATLVKPH